MWQARICNKCCGNIKKQYGFFINRVKKLQNEIDKNINFGGSKLNNATTKGHSHCKQYLHECQLMEKGSSSPNISASQN